MTTPAATTQDDRLLTVEQFASHMQVSPYWVRRRLSKLPGVIRYGRKMTRIHLQTYIERSIRK